MKTPEQGRKEARERAVDRSHRTPGQQLAVLALKRGDAARERARLEKQIAADRLAAAQPKPVRK